MTAHQAAPKKERHPRKRILWIALLVVLVLVIGGCLTWQHYRATHFDASDYHGLGDQKRCLDDYYRVYPHARQPQPDRIQLPPPCPGVPQ